MLEVEKTDRNQYLNNIWLETLIAIIGENLSDSREINGVVMQSRRGKDRVSIWVRDATKMDVQKKLGLNYKDTLGEIPFRLRLQKHSDLSGKTSSRKHLLQL
jgi:translation initiation factor 4E